MITAAPSIDHTRFREVLTARTSSDDWSRWFKDLQIRSTSAEIQLVAPSRFVANQVVSRFLAEVESAARTAGAVQPLPIRVTIEPKALPAQPPTPTNGHLPAPEKTNQKQNPPLPSTRHPSNHHRFDNFQVGPSSLLAYAAATSVAEHPGGNYNPLFIYGGSGLGKTHLLLAIAHRAKEHDPAMGVRYCTSERFVQQFIHSVSRRQMESFRRRFRQVDILILDDFQFLQGKEQTLEEFFWTFDTLHNQGKQVVIGSDRPPRDFDSLADRIRSRVSAGLLTELTAPPLETRMEILRALDNRSPVSLPDDVLQMVAKHITNNVRDLAGALRQLHAYAKLTNSAVTTESVLQQLAPIAGTNHMPRTTETIIASCAEAFGVTVEEILDHNRRPLPSEARQVAMYLTRQITGLPFARIGVSFNRGHSTVLSSHRRVAARISGDADFARRVNAVNQLIHSP